MNYTNHLRVKPTLLLNALTTLTLVSSSLGDVSIPYAVPRDGRTSLAIYDTEGRMVRTLLT